jgi:hypothetical protein
MGDGLARLLRRTVRAAEASPVFLAAVFARYRAVEGLDDAEVAGRLGVTVNRLDELAICRRPRPELFRQDVAAIATRFGADSGALAAIVRQVDGLERFAATPAPGLLAARDADDEPTPAEGRP